MNGKKTMNSIFKPVITESAIISLFNKTKIRQKIRFTNNSNKNMPIKIEVQLK